jgi:hypothetical protein
MNAAQDNVYFKQAYIPYAPTGNMPAAFTASPYGHLAPHAAIDGVMLPVSIVGLSLTVLVGLPIGLFTAPAALKRANQVEHLMNIGRRPASDRGNVTAARVCAWISLLISIPLLLMWLGMILVIAMAFAG